MRLTISTLAGASVLALLTACSGGGGSSSSSTPTYATSLSYTDPTTGAYRLVKDPASSGGTLVLDVVSTAGAPISGVSFSFTADTTKVNWTTTTASVQSGTAFTVGSTPQGVAIKLTGSDLQGIVSQKGTSSPITPTATTVLAKVTMTLKSNISAGTIALTDSGKGAYLDGTGIHAAVITVGTLKAQ